MNPLPHSLYPSFANATVVTVVTVVTVARQQNVPKSRMAPGPSRSRPTTCSEIHEIHGKVGMRNMRNECLRYLRSPDQEIAVVRLSPILMQKALAPEELETRTFTLSTFPAHTTVQIIERRKKVESTNLHSSWYKLKCLFPMFTS